MSEIIANNIYLIILLPFWMFLIIMVGRFFSVYVNKRIVTTLTLLASASGSLITITLYKLFEQDMVYENTLPFIQINDFIISFGIHIDKLSLIFAFILFIISFFVQLFSLSYMKEEKKQYRFYALMNLFNFVMALLFFSPNLFQTYVFWELAGIVSYLLIGFDYNKVIKSIASKKVFIINRIGDTALIAAIIMCSYFMYEYGPCKSLTQLSFSDINTISTLISVYSSHFIYITICMLLIIASAVKSAQMPFYTWLQDAMEAKLPVSALLHSATLVALGIYLLIRMTPLFTLLPSALNIIAGIGVITALICSLSASVENHPKKILAYSTSAQIGLMFFAIGLLNIKAALALFCAHAFIKSMLFISLPEENKPWNYIKFIIFILGCLSLAGLILSGMAAKELLADNLIISGTIVLCMFSLLTAFYTTRLIFVILNKNGTEKSYSQISESIAGIGLLALNACLSLYLIKYSAKLNLCITFWIAVIGVIMTACLYYQKRAVKVPYIYTVCKNGFYLDKFYMEIINKVFYKFTTYLNMIDTNIFSNYKPVFAISKCCRNFISYIETYIMNGYVNLIINTSKKISEIYLTLQTGNIQRYNLYGLIIITLIITCLLIAYISIITNIKGGV